MSRSCSPLPQAPRRWNRWQVAAALCLTLTCAVSQAGEEKLRLVDGPGRDVTLGNCIACHSVDYIHMNAPLMDRARWEKTVAKMIDKFGAPIRKEDSAAILDYLSRYYSAPP